MSWPSLIVIEAVQIIAGAFIPSLTQIEPPHLVGISLSMMRLVLIDMKYQQFVVQAKYIRSLYQGCILAAILLLLCHFKKHKEKNLDDA